METKRSEKTAEPEVNIGPVWSGTPTQEPVGREPPKSTEAKPTDLAEALERVERSIEQIRGHVEQVVRERQHQEFSAARLIGALLQVVVLGFVVAAIADWAYEAKEGPQLVKLAFAAVFQLGALTAFVVARQRT